MAVEWQVVLAVAIFVIVYTLIVTEKIHRTVAALAGGVVVLASGLLTQVEAVHAIDFNTIGLLIGMMVIVGITRFLASMSISLPP